MNLHEALLLLALDEEKGTHSSELDLGPGLAEGVLLELALAGRVASHDGKLEAVGDPPDEPLLAEAHGVLAAEPGRHGAKAWLRRLPSRLKPLEERVAQGLAERGVLEEERGKLLGVFNRTRWPERDPEPERELRSRLRAVLLEGAAAEPRDSLLLSLLLPYGLVKQLVSRDEREAAVSEAKRLADAGVVGAGVDELVEELRGATVNVATTATIGTSVGTGAGGS